MNERQKDILVYFINHYGSYITVRELENTFLCSDKTIRNDLKKVDGWLEENTNCSILRKRNRGNTFLDNKNEREQVLHRLDLEELTIYPKENRIFEEVQIILFSPGKLDLNKLAQMLYVSKQVIREDLMSVQSQLSNFNLSLSISRKGIELIGAEKDIRAFAIYFFTYTHSVNLIITRMQKYFSPSETNGILLEIKKLESNLQMKFTDIGFNQMLLYLFLIIRRIRLRKFIEREEGEIKKEFTDELERLKLWIEKMFAISVPPNEMILISHIIEISVDLSRNIKFEDDEVRIIELAKHLALRVSEKIGVSVYEDEEVVVGLRNYLSRSIYRNKYNIIVPNQLQNEIKKHFFYMFNTVFEVIFMNDEFKNLRFHESEIAQITLYLQTAYEKNEIIESSEKLKGSIISPLNDGVNLYLKRKVQKNFINIEIIDVVSEKQIDWMTSENDFLISFVPLIDCEIPSVIISPLFTNEDKRKLIEFFGNYNEKKKKYKVLPNIIQPLVLPKNIQINKVENVIGHLCEYLIKNEFVQKPFCEDVIKRVEISPIIVSDNILIVYGNSNYVKRSIALITELNQSTIFYNQEISCVVIIAYKPENRMKYKQICGELGNLMQESTSAYMKRMTVDSFVKYLNNN